MGVNISADTRVVRGADRIGLLRRGAGAVERGGLENRCPSYGGPRVRIPPSPPPLLADRPAGVDEILEIPPFEGSLRDTNSGPAKSS
jgi:hypothetical protein